MSNKINQTRVKTENRSTYIPQIYPRSQGYKYSLTNISDSPSTYYSKTKNEKEDQYQKIPSKERYSHPQRYINLDKNMSKHNSNINQYKRNTEKIEEKKGLSQKKSFQSSQKNENHSFYSSNTKNNIGIEKKYDNKTTITYKYNKIKLNENNNSHEIISNKNNNKTNNNIMNINNTRYISNINNLNYKERKTTTNVINTRNDKDNKLNEPINRRQYINKSYEGIKLPPKYYRNNPLIGSNLQTKQNIGKNEEKEIIRPVAQKICNIIIKGRGKKEENKDNDVDKKNDEQENDENNEEEEEMEGEEEEDDNSEEKNSGTPIMKIQRAQNIEQPNDMKTKSQIVSKKNTLKIEKLKNSNFELPKTPTGTLIQMQKAQSFEQPSEVSFNKNKAKKFEMTQLKDCEVELINKPNLAVDEEVKIEYNKDYRRNINQNQKKNIIDFTSIPKTNIINKKIGQTEEKKTEIKSQPRAININSKINNNNESQKKKFSQPKIVIMNKRSNSNAQPRAETKVEKENPNISHKNNNSIESNSDLNDRNNKKDKEKKPVSINKNIPFSIPNSTKKTTSEDINKNEPVNLNPRRNYTISISSNNNERPRSSQKINNINTEPTTKVNKYITTVITVISPKRDLSEDKSKNEKDIEKKNNNFPIINTNKNINEDKNKKELKPNQVKEQYKSWRKNINPKDNNIKIEIINTDIDTQKKTNNINFHKNDKNENPKNYAIKKEKEKDNKDLCYKDKKEIPISNNNRSHTISIIPNSGRNEPKIPERIYVPNSNQRAKSRDKVKVEKNNKSNIGINYISNINRNH